MNPTPSPSQHKTSAQRKWTKLRRRRRRNIIVNTASIVIVAVGIGWLVTYFWRYTQYEITNNAVIDQYITPVNIRVQGYIKRIDFTEHQRVCAGDTLIVIDDAEYRIKVMDAQAALLDARAAASVLESSILTSKSNIEVSSAAIAEADIGRLKIERDEARYADLLNQKSVSLQQYQQVKADYDAATAKVELLRRQKNSVELQYHEMAGRSLGAEAVIARRESDLAMARLNLSYTVVVAPYDGYVGRRTLGEGQLVQAGQILTNIMRSDQKWVTANYKETQVARLFVGQSVNIKVDAYKDRVFRGVVTAISEATGSKYSLIPTDNSAGNFVKVQQRIPVRIDFRDLTPADGDMLRAGMMVQTEAKVE